MSAPLLHHSDDKLCLTANVGEKAVPTASSRQAATTQLLFATLYYSSLLFVPLLGKEYALGALILGEGLRRIIGIADSDDREHAV